MGLAYNRVKVRVRVRVRVRSMGLAYNRAGLNGAAAGIWAKALAGGHSSRRSGIQQ